MHPLVVEGQCREDVAVGDAMMWSTLGGRVPSSWLPHEEWETTRILGVGRVLSHRTWTATAVVAYLKQLGSKAAWELSNRLRNHRLERNDIF